MIRIVVEGFRPRKNARGTMRGGTRITPAKIRKWRHAYAKALCEMMIKQPPSRLAKRGAWGLTLHVYEDQMCHLDVDVPRGDIDSTPTAILDAMQIGRWAVLDDDARIVSMTVTKHYDKARPRVEIELTPWEGT